MSKAAMDYLSDEIERAVNYCRQEYEMSYGEAAGVLLTAAMAIAAEGAVGDIREKSEKD